MMVIWRDKEFMKTSLSSLAAAAVLAGSLFTAAAPANADTITLALSPTNAGTFSTNFVVPKNMTAQVTYTYTPAYPSWNGSWVTVSFPGLPGMLTVSSNSPAPVVAGPATITLNEQVNGNGLGQLAFCTIQTTSTVQTASSTFTPSTAVVIPNDAGGPVTIILESSVDLVNWTPALPGTYGTSTTNRFFRVRAQR